MRDDRLERNANLSLADLQEARQALGSLHAGEPLLPGLRVADEDAEAEREARDIRKRLAGPDRERGEHRIDVAVEAHGERLELGLVELGGPRDHDPLLGKRRPELAGPEARLGGRERRYPLLDLDENLFRQTPVRRANAEAGLVLADEAGHAHHEELVQVRREDRAELDALEERDGRVGRELEHPRVELEPRELAVQEALAGFLRDAGSGRSH